MKNLEREMFWMNELSEKLIYAIRTMEPNKEMGIMTSEEIEFINCLHRATFDGCNELSLEYARAYVDARRIIGNDEIVTQ